MQRELLSWYSPALDKEMPIAVYGHFGFALLLIPTAAADYLEYERFQLIDALKPYIESGKCKVYSINSINSESWLNKNIEGAHKAIRHNQFNQYIFEEVIPFIRTNTSAETPVFLSGASFGALHSMNLFLKRPDIINGVIAMSGVYNLMDYTDGYYDEQVFYNSPMQYFPGLNDAWFLEKINGSKHIHIFSGSGNYEDPSASRSLSDIFRSKNIFCDIEIWGKEWTHDWPTWRKALPYYIDSKF